MPEGGEIKVNQNVVRETVDLLAKIQQFFEANDTQESIRWNKPYLPSRLTAKITEIMGKLTGELAKNTSLEPREEGDSNERV